MVLNTLLLGKELASSVSGFVVDKLDQDDIERFSRGLERPETIIGKKQADIAKKYDIPSYYLINEPTEALQRQGYFDN